jgi:hypothetical protein
MPGAAVVFNTTPLATTFVNSGQLTAVLPDTSMASPLTASISVVQADGTSYKAAAGFTVTNAIPVVSSISPALVHANAGAFTLTVNGSNFVSGAAVFWKSVALATTFVNSTQLTAQVPNGYIASAGAATITVKQPDSVPSTTSCTLTITQPLATVTSISPTTKPAASGAFTLTVMGTQFMTASTVQWNGVALATTFVSATQLTASVPGGRIATPGAIPVTVVQSDGTASTPAVFTVSDPIPALTGLVPSSKPHGNATFVIIVNGTQFLSGATVLWNGAPLATSFVATTQVTATVPAALVTSAGTATITLQQPDGTPATASLTFTVN